MSQPPTSGEDSYQVQWIDSEPALKDALRDLAGAPYCVLDTEFVRIDTYYPRPGLIQLCYRQRVFLVDPVVLESLDALGEWLFGADAPLLVMHACSEDLEVIRRIWGRLPGRLFDTQVAESFLSEDRQLGLQKLVERYLNIAMPKGETRSDWLARPLSDSQLGYAAQDVALLEQVYGLQLDALQKQHRLSWVEEECARQLADAAVELPDDERYVRVRDAWRLTGAELARLRVLAAWRERFAREQDIARNFVASDQALAQLVQRQPAHLSALQNINELKPVQKRRYGSYLLEQIQQWIASPPAPLPLLGRPGANPAQKEAKKLKTWVDAAAQQLGLSPDRLATTRQLTELVEAIESQRPLPESFQAGWRRHWCQPLLAALNVPGDRSTEESTDS